MEVAEAEETIMDDHVDNQTYVLKLLVHGTNVLLQDLEIPGVRVISMDRQVNMLGCAVHPLRQKQGRRRGQEVGVTTGWRPSELPKPLDCFVRLSSAPTMPPWLTQSRKQPRDKVVVELRRAEDQRMERAGSQGQRWIWPVQLADSWQQERSSQGVCVQMVNDGGMIMKERFRETCVVLNIKSGSKVEVGSNSRLHSFQKMLELVVVSFHSAVTLNTFHQ
ncbi:hypothetical protein IW262DRAFT_1298209 [Armillaria fumosa]|nr:hypothetical protein IW262DRAFT_1298209 [Armillaria fumosa]